MIDRNEIMDSIGWGGEWPEMIAALNQECPLGALADALGMTAATLRTDLAKAGLRPVPRSRTPRMYAGRPLAEVAKDAGLNYHCAYKRVTTGAREIGTVGDRGRRPLVIRGRTLAEWAHEWGVCKTTARRRCIARGWHTPGETYGYEASARAWEKENGEVLR